ncbi:MAG: glycosyl transferase family 8 [Rhodospirillales bacterium]|nr:glycosyl transferase family 8 [Rhodospirillales bacterium]
MPELSICLTTDLAYLFPTFACAAWLREQVAPAQADVTIVGIDLGRAALAALAPSCEALAISLLAFPRASIADAPPMFARLFLADILPPHINRILYLDADVQFPGPLAPLLAHRPSPTHFLAARDPMAFVLPGRGRLAARTTAYMASIGLTREEGEHYFNSGVILADREGWAPVGREAWRLFNKSGMATRFGDQDVLNVAGRGRHRPLSLAWNFPVFMRNARLEAVVRPHILHFMSNPKPWLGAFPPWSAAEHGAYATMRDRVTAIAPYFPAPMRLPRWLRSHGQQRIKRIQETVSWGWGERHARIVAYEQSALLHPRDGATGR